MRLSLRFLLPLALVLAGLAYAVIPLVDTLTLKWFVRDLEIRSELIGRMVEGPLVELMATDSKVSCKTIFIESFKTNGSSPSGSATGMASWPTRL